MAKFAFYDINCSKFETEKDGRTEIVTLDTVTIQITKRVNRLTMQGEKGEDYKVPVEDLPAIFVSDAKVPPFKGYDATERIAAVKAFLSQFIGKTCLAEEITKVKRKELTYLEFED